MAGFEDLIRNALQKQGNPSQERREAIYQSSRHALERMLSNNKSLDEATAIAQRERLENAIAEVDKEYATEPTDDLSPAVSASQTETPAQPVQSTLLQPTEPQPTEPEPVVEPVLSSPPPIAGPEVREPSASPEIDSSTSTTPVVLEPETAVISPEPAAKTDHSALSMEQDGSGSVAQSDQKPSHLKAYQGDALTEKKPYIKLLLWTIIIVGLGVAAWWAVTFGPAMLKQKFQSLGASESRTIDSGSFINNGEDDWVKVFSPVEDATNVETNGRGTADLFDDNGKNFVRIASTPGSTRNTVRILVPRGVMETLQGQAATFEMVIKGSGDQPQQFAVFCDFEEMGNCGRQRFKPRSRADVFVFDVLVNDVKLDADTNAYLTFNTDLAATGKSLDLYSIRVRSGT